MSSLKFKCGYCGSIVWFDKNGQISHHPCLANYTELIMDKNRNLFINGHLTNVGANRTRDIDENHLTDEKFQCIAPINKQQFEELLTYCDPVLQNGKLRYRFVPTNIGPESITRQEFIMQHVTEFANELYNPQPEEPRAVAVINSTYADIHKTPDGYSLTIFGPYFSDARNNDAKILRQEFERDAETLQGWFQNGDIVLADRGYRDAIPLLQRLGIDHKMPPLLEHGQRQLPTQDANDSRIVKKNHWVVEARNGHLSWSYTKQVSSYYPNARCRCSAC
ncbi:uncharacterized protein [Temnothorax longispinosus]|uniref:uncharacterized protein isoform X2 n=1 Tax=Temnothorax longispinosus TaxID=300112 RepID=UPI003A9A1079